jgi:hypothetical protein
MKKLKRIGIPLLVVALAAFMLTACGWASDPAECATSSHTPPGTNTRTQRPNGNIQPAGILSPAANVTLDGDLSSTTNTKEKWSYGPSGATTGQAMVQISYGGTHACMAAFDVEVNSPSDPVNGVIVQQDNFNIYGATIVPGDGFGGIFQDANQLGIHNTWVHFRQVQTAGGTYGYCLGAGTGVDNVTITGSAFDCDLVGISGTWGTGNLSETDKGIRINATGNSPSSITSEHGPWFLIGPTIVWDMKQVSLSTAYTPAEASAVDNNGGYLPPAGLQGGGHCDTISLYGSGTYSFLPSTIAAWQAKCTNVIVHNAAGGQFTAVAGWSYAPNLY